MRRGIGPITGAAMLVLGLCASTPALANTYLANKTGDHALNGCTHSDCTLREAVIKANHHAGPDTVELKANKTYTLAIPGPGEDQAATGDLDLRGNVTLRSTSTKRRATVDANHVDRAFDAKAPATFELLKIENGQPPSGEDGGGVLSTKKVTFTRSKLTMNQSSGLGSAVEATGAGMVLSGSQVTANSGIALSQEGNGSIRLVRSAASNNLGPGVWEQGDGGISMLHGKANGNTSWGLEESQGGGVSMSRSKANGNGAWGVIEYDTGNVSASRSTFSGNSAWGIEENAGGSISLTRTQANGNSAWGVVEYDAGSLIARRSSASNNSAWGIEENGVGNTTLARVNANGNSAWGVVENDVGGLNAIRTASKSNGAFGIQEAGGGTLQLSRAKLVSNAAAGVSDSGGGTGAIDKTTIAGNGNTGLTKNISGTLVVAESTISGNHSSTDGGGIFANDAVTLKLTNSTVTRNEAAGNGGGIAAAGTSSVRLNAVTVARNVADSDANGGGLGGGLYQGNGATVRVANSLLALNQVNFILQTGLDCHNATDPFDSGGHNLLTNDSDCDGFDAPGDSVNPAPKIAQLADNGGPTKTIALKAGSPAIGHAGGSAPSHDQRGHKRDKHPDIGAFERA